MTLEQAVEILEKLGPMKTGGSWIIDDGENFHEALRKVLDTIKMDNKYFRIVSEKK